MKGTDDYQDRPLFWLRLAMVGSGLVFALVLEFFNPLVEPFPLFSWNLFAKPMEVQKFYLLRISTHTTTLTLPAYMRAHPDKLSTGQRRRLFELTRLLKNAVRAGNTSEVQRWSREISSHFPGKRLGFELILTKGSALELWRGEEPRKVQVMERWQHDASH